jgi:hypothetical protein
MDADILLVRDGEGFRLLHGHLHLVSVLSMNEHAVADVKGEAGLALIRRTPDGLLVNKDSVQLPLFLQV